MQINNTFCVDVPFNIFINKGNKIRIQGQGVQQETKTTYIHNVANQLNKVTYKNGDMEYKTKLKKLKQQHKKKRENKGSDSGSVNMSCSISGTRHIASDGTPVIDNIKASQHESQRGPIKNLINYWALSFNSTKYHDVKK